MKMKSLYMTTMLFGSAAGHGAIISPRSRNSVDYLVGVNTPKDWCVTVFEFVGD